MKRIILVSLVMCTTIPAFAQQPSFPMRNGLPATNMDSFVYEAGGSADLIYGDEGKWDIPPYDSFTVPHRINSGITGQRAAGITTGHGSYMPDAWGGDEWTGNEWSMSGSGSNGSQAQGGQTVMSPAIQAGGQSGALPATSITGRSWQVGGDNPPPSTGQGGEGDTSVYMSPGSTVTAPPDNGGGNAPVASPGATAPQQGSGTTEGGGG